MRRPLDGNPRITTQFLAPGTGSLGKHLGIDYGVPVGTPVYAPVAGVISVRKETFGTGSGGKQYELNGDDGRVHRFLHLSQYPLSVGTRVAEGQLIGETGATGDVTGPHLHWDVRKANTAWNASLANYLNPESLITGSAQTANNQVSIRLNGSKSQRWNVRRSPDMGNNIRTDGYGLGGQQYGALIVEGGWALINFNGKPGYIGPKAFTKL